MPSLVVEHLSKRYQLGKQRTLGFSWWGLTRSRVTEEEASKVLKRKLRGEVWALKDVSFRVEPGTIVGVIGPNGAGKTTLLKVIARVTPPTAGRVIGQGRVVSLLELGVGFHPSLSGRENVFLNAAIYGIRQAEISQHFDELVKFAGLEEFIDTPVSRYSSGMYLRLAFSTAIHMEPDILLADEVLAVGDLNFQEKCLERVQQEGDAGKIVLFVSHDMAAITRLCHEVIWLEAGQIVDRGKPEEIVARYQDSVWKPRAVKLGKRGNQGHEQVRIISVGLRSQEGTEIGSARLSEDFFITILFEVDGKNMKARPSFDLYTHNVLVLRTGLWEEIPIAEPGAYAAQARIPRCFLVDTIYSVNVSIRIEQDGGLTSVKVHNALSFRVYDDEALATERRGSREGPARGVVAPRLEWDWRRETEKAQEKVKPTKSRRVGEKTS